MAVVVTPAAIGCVRANLARLQPDLAALGTCFYDHLFALAPQARDLFPAQIPAQAGKLADMLACVVAALDQPDRLDDMLTRIGQRHVGYGASEADYDAVGAALLRALRDCLGPAWTPQLADAWGEVYGAMAEAMIAAGHAPGRNQPPAGLPGA